jgi:hypothetical protein
MSIHNIFGYFVIWIILNFMLYALYKRKFPANDIIDFIQHKDTGLKIWAKNIKSIFIMPTRIYVFAEGILYYFWKSILYFFYTDENLKK